MQVYSQDTFGNDEQPQIPGLNQNLLEDRPSELQPIPQSESQYKNIDPNAHQNMQAFENPSGTEETKQEG